MLTKERLIKIGIDEIERLIKNIQESGGCCEARTEKVVNAVPALIAHIRVLQQSNAELAALLGTDDPAQMVERVKIMRMGLEQAKFGIIDSLSTWRPDNIHDVNHSGTGRFMQHERWFRTYSWFEEWLEEQFKLKFPEIAAALNLTQPIVSKNNENIDTSANTDSLYCTTGRTTCDGCEQQPTCAYWQRAQVEKVESEDG